MKLEACHLSTLAVLYKENMLVINLFLYKEKYSDMHTTTQMARGQAQGEDRPGEEAIVVDNFTKSYGSHRVVDRLTFTVYQGEIFALLGPNGAGKTTTIETLEGYRTADQGKVRVGYYRHPQNVDSLLERVGLQTAGKTRCRRLSGGQKRRLALALALVGNPSLVFLDEPTAGMDPQARLATWEIIRDLKRNGATVLLTTHLMDEAERLSDRVAIIDHGRLIALDTPGQLTGVQNATVVRFVASAGLDCAQLAALPSASKAEEIRAGSYFIETEDAPALIAELAIWLREQKIPLTELRVGHGSLEDVFLRLTGTEMKE